MSTQIKPPESQSLGISLNDIYYALFRHKRKIVVLSAVGILTGAILYFVTPRSYVSEAKLLVRYILESKSINPAATDSQIKSPDTRGENIINSELEILSSLDLAKEVVDLLGADKILAKAGGGADRNRAAGLIRKNLKVEPLRNSNVIRLLFQHPDPEISQVVLRHLIDGYRKKHLEIHRGLGLLDDFLTRQTDQLRSRLADTELELRKVKTNAGIISLEESKRAYSEEISRIRQGLFIAEAELEERKAAIKELEKISPAQSPEAAAEVGATVDNLNEYKNVCTDLETLLKKEREYLGLYTKENPMVQRLREQIKNTEGRKNQLEQESPKLATLATPATGLDRQPIDLAMEITRARALEAKIAVFASQLDKIRAEAAYLDATESSLAQLQRKKQLEEANYKYYSASLEQARVDEALGPGKVSNINVVQEPSPPGDTSERLKKAGIALAVSLAAGIALAFLLELFLDQSVRRPLDIEQKLRLPLFLTIPNTVRNGNLRRVSFSRRKAKPGIAVDSETAANGPITAIQPWQAGHTLRPFYEGLRDRLVQYFELKQMTHKPKLVGLTSCTTGSGVSTIATALAATLSETGEGNVLLVDMHNGHNAAHPYYRGKVGCPLPEALENEKRDMAQVQQNLFLASATNANGHASWPLAKRITHLVPKFKASDYDYIIFDMPPVAETTVTARVAAFMDLVLVVAESEKTNRDLLQRATASLHESNASVNIILNKQRTYVPQWLHAEL